MRSLSDILIAITIDHICEHFEIESLVDVCWIFYEVVVTEIARFKAICVGECSENV